LGIIKVFKDEISSEYGSYTDVESLTKPSLFMLLSAFSFALMGALSHFVGERCDWRLILIARTFLTFVIAVGVAIATNVRLVFLKPATLWLRSIAGSVAMPCTFYALTHLPISTAFSLTNTFPLWVTVLSWPMLGHRPKTKAWVAVIIGVCGVILIQQPDLSGSRTAGLIAISGSVCTAIAIIGINKINKVHALAIIAHYCGVSTTISLVCLLLSGAKIDYAMLEDYAVPLLGVGIVGTLGQFGLTRAFTIGDPARIAVVGLTQIVFALGFDLIFWERHLDILTLAGILLVVAPTAWLLMHHPIKKVGPLPEYE